LLEFPPCLKGYIVWPLPPTFEKKIKNREEFRGKNQGKGKKEEKLFFWVVICIRYIIPLMSFKHTKYFIVGIKITYCTLS